MVLVRSPIHQAWIWDGEDWKGDDGPLRLRNHMGRVMRLSFRRERFFWAGGGPKFLHERTLRFRAARGHNSTVNTNTITDFFFK